MAKKTRRTKAKKQSRKKSIQYHVGFIGSMNCELWAYRDSISIEAEKELTRKPQKIDCLVLKTQTDTKINSEVANHFRGHNIIDYKSWRILINMSMVLQIHTYATQYAETLINTNPKVLSDMTLTIFTHKKPEAFFDSLQEKYGCSYEMKHNGVYQISGFSIIELWVVVIEELPPQTAIPIRILLPGANKEDVKRFMEQVDSNKDPDFQRYADMVMYYCTEANSELINDLKGEVPAMAENIMKMREREIRAQDRAEANRKVAEVRTQVRTQEKIKADKEMANAVKCLISAHGVTFEQACQTLGLSRSKKARISQYLDPAPHRS